MASRALADSVSIPVMLWNGVIQWKPKWPQPEYCASFTTPDSPASSALLAISAPYHSISRHTSGSANGRIGSA